MLSTPATSRNGKLQQADNDRTNDRTDPEALCVPSCCGPQAIYCVGRDHHHTPLAPCAAGIAGLLSCHAASLVNWQESGAHACACIVRPQTHAVQHSRCLARLQPKCDVWQSCKHMEHVGTCCVRWIWQPLHRGCLRPHMEHSRVLSVAAPCCAAACKQAPKAALCVLSGMGLLPQRP